ncbi:MAG: HD domain-containing phosphohydrolase [Capsulimonadaceae bacterium]|nr:HD domain-containing phosphohydrolase [Capsulimonadaceae bacterium]
MPTATTTHKPLRLGDLLTSLSAALDITAGQPSGHAVRACVIGLRIATAMGLSEQMLLRLHYALMLKDAGASSTSTRLWQLFAANEVEAKRSLRLLDWSSSVEVANFFAKYIRPDDNPLNRARRIMRNAANSMSVRTGINRDRAIGAEAAVRTLDLDEVVIEGIKAADEHWDGSGLPSGRSSHSIPVFGRIIALATALDTFAAAYGPERAYAALGKQSGVKFDPDMFQIAKSFETDHRFWTHLKERPRQLLSFYDTAFLQGVQQDSKVDKVCQAFARIVDAKSPYMRAHSERVSQYAVQMGEAMELPPDRLRILKRAALLHDIGKLAVPNNILEKPQKLTPEEWERIKKYPFRTEQILTPISGFRRLGAIACSHNERLDGSGYHRGVTGELLDLDMRIVAVADVYDALTSERPQRAAMPLESVFRILDEQSRTGLDKNCVSVLQQIARGGRTLQAAAAHGAAGPELRAA